jgi:hypothetical protein
MAEFMLVQQFLIDVTTEKRLRKAALAGIVVWLCIHVAAAAVDPFYLEVYRRGMLHYDAGEFGPAARELRLAAFGFVDQLEQFETAHIYAAIAASKQALDADAGLSAQRVLAAERVARTYPTLALPPAVRTAFEAIAKKALTPQEYAYLTSNAPAPARATPEVKRMSPGASQSSSSAAGATATAPEAPAPAPASQSQSQHPQMQPTGGAPAPVKPASTLADADRALASGDMVTARSIFVALLGAPDVTHEGLLRLGEGLDRTHAFNDAITAFTRAGTFAKGEERYHYYYAVALYETGQYRASKRELAASLPFVELTPELSSYRARIEAATD